MQSIKAYERTSDMILKTIPRLYAEGLSTRDFHRALKPFWKKAGLSRSSISRASKQLHAEFDAWRRRDLSKLKVLYLFLDGVNERVRFGRAEKEGVLVAYLCAVAGDDEQAERTLREWDYPWSPGDQLDRARVHAVLGDRAAALTWLEKAKAAGARLPKAVPIHPDFASLTDDPRFRAAMERIRRE